MKAAVIPWPYVISLVKHFTEVLFHQPSVQKRNNGVDWCLLRESEKEDGQVVVVIIGNYNSIYMLIYHTLWSQVSQEIAKTS